MKRSIKILLCVALCILPAGICNAQTNETTSPATKVEDAPAWFFNPLKDEYAGASLPLRGYETARRQAIYSALLSFAAQNKTTVAIRGAAKSYSNAQGGKENSELERIYECTFSLPDQCRVVETAVNQYGEVFVLIKVTDAGSKSSIRMVAELYDVYEKRDGFVKDERQLSYSLADSSLHPDVEVNMAGREFTQNEETTVNVKIERATKYTVTQEFGEPEAKFRYRSTNVFEVSDKGETKMPSMSGAFFSPVQHSLGWAYTAALLKGIIEDCRRIAEERASYADTITVESVSPAGRSNGNEEIGSQIMNRSITKPARALKAEITDELLYFTDVNMNENTKKGILIRGTVTGATGEPLSNVDVVVKGTRIDAVTDNNGRYAIRVSNREAVLAFSLTDYVMVEVTVGNRVTIDVNMSHLNAP